MKGRGATGADGYALFHTECLVVAVENGAGKLDEVTAALMKR
jgi:hypothetical protein